MRFRILVVLVVCVLPFIGGCNSQGWVPAGGKVVYEDGSPVTSGSVVFTTESFMATGNINHDGTYALSSLKEGDGLPVGMYTVLVSASEPSANNSEVSVDLVDPVYANRKQALLKATVEKGGKNQFDFTVKKPASSKR